MSSYIDETDEKKEKQEKESLNQMMASLGLANLDINQANEEKFKALEEEEARRKAKEAENAEAEIFANRYREEQERRKAFEEELAQREAEEEALRKAEEEKKKEKKIRLPKEKEYKGEKQSIFSVLKGQGKKKPAHEAEEKTEDTEDIPAEEPALEKSADGSMTAADYAASLPDEPENDTFTVPGLGIEIKKPDFSSFHMPDISGLSSALKKKQPSESSSSTAVTGPEIKKMPRLSRKERKAKEAEERRRCELERYAYEDSLTKYPNRNKFEDDLNEITGNVVAVLVSIPRYDEAVKSFGPEAGDKMILGVKYCLETTVVANKIYRVDTDKFLILYLDKHAKEIRLETKAFEGKCLEKGVVYDEHVLTLTCILDVGFGSSLKEAVSEMLADERKMKPKEKKILRDNSDNRPLVLNEEKKEENPSGVVKRTVVSKKPEPKKGKRQGAAPSGKTYDFVEPDYNNITANETVGEFKEPTGDGEYKVDDLSDEQKAFKKEMQESPSEVTPDLIYDMIEDIREKRDAIIMIAVISYDMENLMLMREADKFLNYCEKAADDIKVSYIYAVYRDYGAKYYLVKPEDQVLDNIFQAVGTLFIKNDSVTGQMISEIPAIGLFQHIYVG